MLRELDPSSDRAAFRQIADHLRDDIASGRLAPGDRLPSESTLMDHYRVSRITVRQALALLRSEGLVVAEHGRGVFVRERPPVRRLASDRFARRHRKEGKAAFEAEVAGEGRKPTVDRIEISETTPPPDIAKRLGLGPRDKAMARRRRYLVDGRPVETAVSYLPLAIAKGTPIAMPNPGPGGIYARLEDMGYELAGFTEDVSSRMPTAEETRLLAIPPGTPVISLVRTAYAEDDRPVEVCDTVMVADAFLPAFHRPTDCPLTFSLTFSPRAASATVIPPASTLNTIRVFFSPATDRGLPMSRTPLQDRPNSPASRTHPSAVRS